MQTLMQTLAEKLYEEREKEAQVKNDHTALLKAVFRRDDLDPSLNDSAELAETVEQVLSSLTDIERYCVEERYLHGKPLPELAKEFRRNLDMEEFTGTLVDSAYNAIEHEFMENVAFIFRRMKENSFRELEYLDGMHPDSLPKNDTYYEPEADKTVVEILRCTLKSFDGRGVCFKDVFEKYFLQGNTKEELAQWLSENMEDFAEGKCLDGLRRLRILPANSRPLKRFIGADSHPAENKCKSCLYLITAGIGEEAAECSLCRTDEVREWLDKALSELSGKERQVMRELYDQETGRRSADYKKAAVKLRLDSKEYVRTLEGRALKALRRRALRELRAKNK